jgi:pyruvate/2-oxoglutarate dehydrogenase complex dihydrolipoamide dehydrogenase (E3) component
MQAALSLAELDCEVFLVEKSEQLGGLVALAARLPHLRLADLAFAIDDLARRLDSSPVSVELGSELSESLLRRLQPEVLILATGSTVLDCQEPPTMWTSGLQVLTSVDYLAGHAVGSRVIVDGHGEGAELAVSLARAGHTVSLVESAFRLPALPYDYSERRLEALNDYLREEGVTTYWSSRVGRTPEGKLQVERRNGSVVTPETDTLLIAGRRPARVNVDYARGTVPTIVEIGDCRAPRGIGEALTEARMIANSIAA